MSHVISSKSSWREGKNLNKNSPEFIHYFLISHCVCKCTWNDLHQTNWNVHSLTASINRIESIWIEFEARFIATDFFVSMDFESCLFDNNLLPNWNEMQPAFFHRCIPENGLHLIQHRTFNLNDCIRIFNLRANERVCMCSLACM